MRVAVTKHDVGPDLLHTKFNDNYYMHMTLNYKQFDIPYIPSILVIIIDELMEELLAER